jgi:hypothetical protein
MNFWLVQATDEAIVNALVAAETMARMGILSAPHERLRNTASTGGWWGLDAAPA